jgi:hypothetical protein
VIAIGAAFGALIVYTFVGALRAQPFLPMLQ